ncbi:CDGSH iron-sulfur domain-containing protein [uncultured Roseovarius sp.]|uniref:CDGSH iron-sulfur domain-containing protein n=1 Tax=uncultured Roseovarius sp. TaxID=293344 RepID=UPI0026295A2B|nr:CDGSH iron-sulfur domain-containing protein [uncultured Roseovarius sp.]
MKTRIHAIAGGIGFLMILLFWTSTAISELFASHETIAAVKGLILKGMFILIPAMAIAGGSGTVMGKNRTDAKAVAKKKRMPLIAMNGLLILLPSAWFLAGKAAAGEFDTIFYTVQMVELVAGAANLTMMGLNIRDGLTMTGRIGGSGTPPANPHQPVIEERPGGPLVAKSPPRLTDTTGEELETQPVIALCRCGQSKKKPYCDGSHNDIGFTTDPSADRTPDGVKVFGGKQIDVHYNRLLCSHAGECGARLKAVFDSTRDPWIVPDNATPDQIRDVVETCPSGALSWSEPGRPAQHVVGGAPGITIEGNGPYRVTRIPLASGIQAEGASPDKYVLCRCGASKNKPFCDGSHADIGWTDRST